MITTVLLAITAAASQHAPSGEATRPTRETRCIVPTQVIRPFNNSPGAIQQSEAATRIVLSTARGRSAFPEVDARKPVCSTFAVTEEQPDYLPADDERQRFDTEADIPELDSSSDED